MTSTPPLGTVQVLPDDVCDAIAGLRTALSVLHDARRRADLSVDVLLDGGWWGRAAERYADGWREWQHGCDAVIDALDTMASLVAAAAVDLGDADDGVAGRAAVLHERLWGR